MQNQNNPVQPPPGGYGAPPQPAPKKGMSTAAKIIIVVVLVVVVGGGALLAIGIGGFLWYRNKATSMASSPTGSGLSGYSSSTGSSSSSSSDDSAETPQPTSEQSAAIAGGQTATWEQQEISWTVPQRWKKYSAESQSFMWRSPGSWDAASLIVSISPLSADFPTDMSLNAYYNSAMQDKLSGKNTEARLVLLDGVKGVMFREAAPESSDNPQRLQWIGYRKYKGQTQMVNIMLASQGKYFTQHEDAMYGILYSTKMTK
jgi:hypothetical protein